MAALLVVVSHAWPLTGTVNDPLAVWSRGQINGGSLGVMMFFAMSGFLVTESFLRRQSVVAFFEARLLRLMPALAACLVFGILIGAWLTTEPQAAYWSDGRTWLYLTKNLILDVRYDLPGVFATNPHPHAMNGSLWTLPGEWLMYCLVAIVGGAAILAHTPAANAVLLVCITTLFLSPSVLAQLPYNLPAELAKPMLAFMVGMLLKINQDRMKWRFGWVIVLIGVAVIKSHRPGLGPLLLIIAVSYTTLWLAVAAQPVLAKADAWGDPSYGLYVYAFPIQQTLVHLWQGVSPPSLAAASVVLTAVVAYASWWWIEKPALALKGRIVARAKL